MGAGRTGLAEAKVVRVGIEHVYVDRLKRIQDGRRLSPVGSKLLAPLFVRRLPNVVRELRWPKEKCLGEIEDEGRFDHRHLDCQFLIVETDKLGNLAATYAFQLELPKMQVCIPFPQVGSFFEMELEC